MIADVPSPTPAACAVPNAPPHAINVVRPVGAEKYIEANHKSGVVDIKVFLAPDGTVTKAVVYHSSGDTFLDGATYDAAIATAYAPEIRNCQAIAGAYIYRTKYNIQSSGPAAGPSPAPPPVQPSAAPVSLPPPPTPGPSLPPYAAPKMVATMVPTMIPTTIATRVPTSYPTTIATTVATTVPTTIPTTIATTVATSVPTTIATTVPGTVQTMVPSR